MKNKTYLFIHFLLCVSVAGCAPQQPATPTTLPATATPVLDADTLSEMLIQAVKDSDEMEVARLIVAGAPVDQAIDTGITPLMIATINEEAEIIRLLLDAGADPEVKTLSGLTALVIAAQQGRVKSIRPLVDGGADIDGVDAIANHNSTPLNWAAYLGKTDAVRELIAAGAELDSVPSGPGDTPLISAVRANRLECVKLLVDAKADLAYRNRNGKSALDYAVELRYQEMVDILKSAGAM